MAILVNWFEVTFDRKDITLPVLTCSSWEESTPILDHYPATEIVRVRQPDQSIRLYFVTVSLRAPFPRTPFLWPQHAASPPASSSTISRSTSKNRALASSSATAGGSTQ